MAYLDVPVDAAHVEALDDFLASDRSPLDSMLLSDLDGFLTAIAIGPEPIMPSEWMPIVWGGEEPVFDSEAEMQAVLGGMLGLYNVILRGIADRTFEPILLSNRDGTLIASDWTIGFMQAVTLRPKAWEPLFRSKDDSCLLLPLVALAGDEKGDSLLDMTPEEEAAFMDEATRLLPATVLAIADYWKRRGRTSRSRSVLKPGRNDPCPCGSGAKFKKCCGARS